MHKRLQIILADHYLAGIYGRKFEQAGYRVHVCESLRDGMAHAAKVKPTVILLDVHTVEHIEEAIRMLRAHPLLKSVKLLLLGSVVDGERIQAYKRLSDGYLLYGHFVPREAIQKVNNLFEHV